MTNVYNTRNLKISLQQSYGSAQTMGDCKQKVQNVTFLYILCFSRFSLAVNIVSTELTLWNANGLTQDTEEMKSIISNHNTGIMLISKMHFTEKSYLKLPNYIIQTTQAVLASVHTQTT
jgi:hypothetical protein